MTNPNSVSSLGLRQITDCTVLIGLGYKHLQALVYVDSFKLFLGLQWYLRAAPALSELLGHRANKV